MRVAVVDCETTGEDPAAGAELLELGVAVLFWGRSDYYDGLGPTRADGSLAPPYLVESCSSVLVGWPRPIPPEASAVHHITERTLAEESTYSADFAGDWFLGLKQGCAAVAAHNAAFDRQFAPAHAGDPPWVCTWRCAMHLWPDAPGHGLQVLRYWLGLPCDRVRGNPHRAAYDAAVAAHLLARELDHVRSLPGLNGGDPLAFLVRLTGEPVLLSTVRFGKYRGRRWSDVPRDYLEWAARQQFDADVLHTVRHHLTGGVAS